MGRRLRQRSPPQRQRLCRPERPTRGRRQRQFWRRGATSNPPRALPIPLAGRDMCDVGPGSPPSASTRATGTHYWQSRDDLLPPSPGDNHLHTDRVLAVTPRSMPVRAPVSTLDKAQDPAEILDKFRRFCHRPPHEDPGGWPLRRSSGATSITLSTQPIHKQPAHQCSTHAGSTQRPEPLRCGNVNG